MTMRDFAIRNMVKVLIIMTKTHPTLTCIPSLFVWLMLFHIVSHIAPFHMKMYNPIITHSHQPPTSIFH